MNFSSCVYESTMYVFDLISVVQQNENLQKNFSAYSEMFGVLILMHGLRRSTLVFLHRHFFFFFLSFMKNKEDAPERCILGTSSNGQNLAVLP